MDKRTAKRLSLKVWGYLKEHPDCDKKSQLPKELLTRIIILDCQCPLCEYFHKAKSPGCILCPLHYITCENYECIDWFNWENATHNSDRKKCAEDIFNKIKAWEVK